MKCECGFEFAGPGELRNCEAFVTSTGRSGVICPKCCAAYVDGQKVIIDKNTFPAPANGEKEKE